ncbi:Transposase IS200 like protein [Adhaeretor mobilis]|uniref:Transposase IS200 like protein n=1 Tax=Adhaeretor mobilis TaxID=1930276 RepID=A0A517MXF4_9BACT|nr:Transposase IS200 like protein [Adhaeretor mobilis]
MEVSDFLGRPDKFISVNHQHCWCVPNRLRRSRSIKTDTPEEGPEGSGGSAMKDWRSQPHVKWDCTYHIVIVPKYRRRKFYGSLRVEIGKILRQLCRQKEVELVEGKAMLTMSTFC